MNNSKAPLYFQVYEDIKTRIVNGEYEEGTKLPSERKLCDLYDVSRITIRESLDRLEQEQMIRREHGKGSIVLGNHYTQVLNSLYSFKDEIEKNGKQASTKVISMDRIDVTPFLQEKMGLTSFHSVYHLIRLRLANGQPMIY
ncbi:GntR family transcriptional regulator [Streptococcus porcinus]